jgi:hypothetical protein
MHMRFLAALVLATFSMGAQFKAIAATFATDDLGVSITMRFRRVMRTDLLQSLLQ